MSNRLLKKEKPSKCCVYSRAYLKFSEDEPVPKTVFPQYSPVINEILSFNPERMITIRKEGTTG